MDLKEFVRESLVEISRALQEANDTYKKERQTDQKPFLLSPGKEKEEGRGIHFDLAVTTRFEGAGGASGKFNIKVVELRAGSEAQVGKESISRISFTVTISHYIG
jgi:hypothetical protein